MSSDPFADLARSLEKTATDLSELINGYGGTYTPTSPAAKECSTEQYPGAWGQQPGHSGIVAAILSTAVCIDHIRATAILIDSRVAVASLHTVARGAVEAVSKAYYLTDPAIDQRERVRRSINMRLHGMHEDIARLRTLDSPDAEIDRLTSRIAAFKGTAIAHGFAFHPANGYKPPYLETADPSATNLVKACVGHDSLGKHYYQSLSAIAHSNNHGILSLLMDAPPGSGTTVPGSSMKGINQTAGRLASDLFCVPLAVATLLDRRGPFLGWDLDRTLSSVPPMLHTWCRIQGVSYPGPDFSRRPAPGE